MDKAHYAVLIPAEGPARPQAINLVGDVLLVEDGGEDFAYYTYGDALDIAETINAACGL